MAGVSAGAQPGTSARSPARRRAAGIYGTIITAALGLVMIILKDVVLIHLH
jgi:hypothetical protein